MRPIKVERFRESEIKEAIKEKLEDGFKLIRSGSYKKTPTQHQYYAIFEAKEVDKEVI